uniref:Serpin domain-containing protein n=1 Tax=Esox lucius TaxID=8010 RepID=A0AAY5JXU3_ESOLU
CCNIMLYYMASFESVDFKHNVETVAQNINTWVEKQTAGKIKDLLPKRIFDELTKLVWVNWSEFSKRNQTFFHDCTLVISHCKSSRRLFQSEMQTFTEPLSDNMKTEKVQVSLPKFKLESDFSGISPSKDLVLSKLLHKAVVEVNEEGTEAAADTDKCNGRFIVRRTRE